MWSLRRLPSAPAAHGIFSTLFCESFLRCLSPYPGGSAECACLVLPQRHRPSPNEKEVGFPLLPANTTFHGPLFRGCSYSFTFRPPSLLASRFVPTAAGSLCRAAEAFTSEPNVHRYLCTHRVCYPPDYGQLAERGLTPRNIHSFVDCSSQLVGSPQRTVPQTCF